MQYEITDHDREALRRQLDALKTAFTNATVESIPTDEIRAYNDALSSLEETADRLGILAPEDNAWTYEGGVQPAMDGERTFGWIDADYGNGDDEPSKQFGIKLDADDSGALVVHVCGDPTVIYRVEDERTPDAQPAPEPSRPVPSWKYAVEFGADHPETGVRTPVLEWGLFDSVAEAQAAASKVLGETQDEAWIATPPGIERTHTPDADGGWVIVGYTIERYDGEMTDPGWRITVDLEDQY